MYNIRSVNIKLRICIWRDGFVSTGGIETAKEFVEKLELQLRQKILDVGCGIGGSDFYMSDNFDVDMVGIDLSINMASFALEWAIGRKCSVEFEVVDCTKKHYPDKTVHVIYSRDTILHIQDKPTLFRKFFKWLKPGGKILISDYCRRYGKPSYEFAQYIKQWGYDLHDVEVYGQMLKDARSREVIAEDQTNQVLPPTFQICSQYGIALQKSNYFHNFYLQFLEVLEKELDAVEKNKDAFIKDFSKDNNRTCFKPAKWVYISKEK